MRLPILTALLALALCASACSTTKTEQADEADEASVEETTGQEGAVAEQGGDTSEVKPFEGEPAYGGRILLPSPLPGGTLSVVVRTQAEYDAFVSRLPREKVQKTNDASPNPDPLAKKPAIDFSKQMLVAGVCPSFYCSYRLEGTSMDGDALVIHGEPLPEPEGAAMAQRPVGMGSADAYGNYVGVLMERHDGEVRFEEPPRPRAGQQPIESMPAGPEGP